jgi:hypothetical protein
VRHIDWSVGEERRQNFGDSLVNMDLKISNRTNGNKSSDVSAYMSLV